MPSAVLIRTGMLGSRSNRSKWGMHMIVQKKLRLARRTFLQGGVGGALMTLAAPGFRPALSNEAQRSPSVVRGLVLVPANLSLADWPRRGKNAGLNTITLHHWDSPQALCEFVATDAGQAFLAQCRDVGIDVEFDYHAMRDLVPRKLFALDPTLFRMDEKGKRTSVRNFCVHSKAALDLAAENAVIFAERLPTSTNRYYYWSDGCAAWCRCPSCRELSDSDQSLVVENYLVGQLRKVRPEAQVAHLACVASMPKPTQVKPAPGVFLQFAPARRRYDRPYAEQRDVSQVDSLWYLERNLEIFPVDTAQILEYWLDVSNFGAKDGSLPWNRERFLNDLATYRALGLRHFKSFGNGIDAAYVERHGEIAFLREYGDGLNAQSN